MQNTISEEVFDTTVEELTDFLSSGLSERALVTLTMIRHGFSVVDSYRAVTCAAEILKLRSNSQ